MIDCSRFVFTSPQRRKQRSYELDQRSGSSFYNVRISVDEPRNALGELKLIPGMPVEAFIKTFDRTAISYLLKPITDQLQRAFKDS